MASEHVLNKPAADGHEPSGDEDLEQSPAPQTQPPFLSDGPELVRDSHC
jgi:hypothetical protein